MKVNNRATGNKFEQIAQRYLIKNNYKILGRNFYSRGYGEIDIIAEKEDRIIFVEVKGRNTLIYGPGEYSITFRKQQNLIQSSEIWMIKNHCKKDWQIDVISIYKVERKLKKVLKLRHFKNCITL